jgi:hypothetical protein
MFFVTDSDTVLQNWRLAAQNTSIGRGWEHLLAWKITLCWHRTCMQFQNHNVIVTGSVDAILFLAVYFTTRLFLMYLRRFFSNSDYTVSNERLICERWIGKDLEGNGRGIILGLGTNTKIFSLDSRSPGRDLNPGPPEYKARPRHSVCRCWMKTVQHGWNRLQPIPGDAQTVYTGSSLAHDINISVRVYLSCHGRGNTVWSYVQDFQSLIWISL